jgi:NhaP-type Na+/H+ or K+/H+ antiporter
MRVSENILREFAMIGTAGVAVQWLSWRFGNPSVAWLLLAGLLLGPASGLIDPGRDFGPVVQPLVSAAVALILFEGGLSLNFKELRETSVAVRRTIFLGGPLMGGGAALAAHYIAGLSWPTSTVLAAILVVSGPTIITPMLKGARLDKRVASILRWESIVNDPVGTLLAVMAIEAAAALHGERAFAGLLIEALGGLAFSVAAAYALGRAIATLFDRGYAPEHLKAPILLIAVLALFVVADAMFDQSGLMAVTVLGITLANLRFANLHDISRFMEAVATLLVSGVFIVLTAQVDVASLRALDLRAALFIFVLLFVLRPAIVALLTIGTGLNWRERLFIGWIAPRGIIAVTISALFGEKLKAIGVADGQQLASFAFAIVCATVALHGFTLRPIARTLGLLSSERQGLLLVGASPWTEGLAEKLVEGGLPVLIVDSDWRRLQDARLGDLPCWFGEILSTEAHHALDLANFSHIVAATPNNAYNSLVCQEFGTEFGRDRVFQLGLGRADEGRRNLHFTIGGGRLFGAAMDFDDLQERLRRGWVFSRTRLSDQFDLDAWRDVNNPEIEILFWTRGDGEIAMNDARIERRPGANDTLYAFGPVAGAKRSLFDRDSCRNRVCAEKWPVKL